ncbi:hypothetical protein DRP53_02305 [candidate division WOR-3 bacterium]|uniref:Uncharacterized protein n=1 Tax=candidate division WOR-3 bacterium TaxID=2052148 RepID=A0A660SK74_UNCW3|nr:MAG: hypothetical protein DRP53_02305 [candidate division WOR-3 bacterium]
MIRIRIGHPGFRCEELNLYFYNLDHPIPTLSHPQIEIEIMTTPEPIEVYLYDAFVKEEFRGQGIEKVGFIRYQKISYLNLWGMRLYRFTPKEQDVRSSFAVED